MGYRLQGGKVKALLTGVPTGDPEIWQWIILNFKF